MMPLGLLREGEEGEVMEIKGRHRGFHGCIGRGDAVDEKTRIADMGIRVGKYIEIIHNAGKGPLIVKIDESRIAIGRGIAMKIFVRRIEQ
jgi:ferrous iron transport protein A